jgi:hypothetical protein
MVLLLVFSGGTAMNCVCSKFKEIGPDLVYVMTVTDNGGSTAEVTFVRLSLFAHCHFLLRRR